LIDKAAVWQKRTKIVFPPREVVEDFRTDLDSSLERLDALVHAPFFAPSGRLVATYGYDTETRLFADIPEELRGLVVSTTPTVQQVADARALIDDALHDFSFRESGDRANAFAKLLDPFTRTMHASITPLYAVSAPVQGSGKSLLVDVLTLPATGQGAQRTPFPRSESEIAKVLLSLLRSGQSHVQLDNVVGRVESPTLASFLTSDVYSGRILGRSETVSVPQRVNLSMSGNNLSYSGDMPRRVVPIFLDPGVERPDQRDGFRHPNLLAWMAENRRQLVESCLTLVQAWVAEGRPDGAQVMGSFERWAAITGGILEVAGVEGFLANQYHVRDEVDIGYQAWASFVQLWWEEYESTTVRPSQLAALPEESLPFFTDDSPNDHSAAIRMGRALAEVQDRVFGEYVIKHAGRESHSGSQVWRLEPRTLGDSS
jgi:hypothetical protein